MESALPLQPQPSDDDASLKIGIFRTARNRLELCTVDDNLRESMTALSNARRVMQLLKYGSRSGSKQK